MRGYKLLIAVIAVLGGTASGTLAGTYHPGDFRMPSTAADDGTDPTNVKP